MKRLPYVCLAALAWTIGQPLCAQSSLQAQLEVNLGPINIDNYSTAVNSELGVASGPYIPACSYGRQAGDYRACLNAVLNAYGQQGVKGVRFQFDMNGLASTPFTDHAGTLSPAWQANFSLFLQDLRAANIRYVSISPDWLTYGLGPMAIRACVGGVPGARTYDFTCESPNAVFYPWVPWALEYVPGTQGAPIDEKAQFAYYNAPQLQLANPPGLQPWPWSSSSGPLFNFFNFIFGAIADAQLKVHEVDIMYENHIWFSSLYGRMIYDNVQHVRPLDIIDEIMVSHGLDPTATTSTQNFQPAYASTSPAPCLTQNGDSFLVAPAYLLLSAQTMGWFGAIRNTNDMCNPPLIDPNDMVTFSGSVGASYPPNPIDIHNYPVDTVYDPVWGWIGNSNFSGCQKYPDGAPVNRCTSINPLTSKCNGWVPNCVNDQDGDPSTSSIIASNYLYSAIYNFVQHWVTSGQIPSSAPVIIGETDEYNPGGIGRDGIWFPALSEGSDCTRYGPYNLLYDDFGNPLSLREDADGSRHAINWDCLPDWKWHRSWSTEGTPENATSFKASGLNAPANIIRPWQPPNWGTVLSPAPLSGGNDYNRPYYVGTCNIPQPQASQVPAGGGPVTISVAAPSGCWWSVGPVPVPVAAPLSWAAENVNSASVNGQPCSYPSFIGSNCWGNGAQSAALWFAANPGPSPRSVQVMIAGYTTTITQAGNACTYSINPVSANPSFTSGSGSTYLTESGSCQWTISSDAAWLTYSPTTPQTSSGWVLYFVTANASSTPRTAHLTIAGQTFTVTQAGAPGAPKFSQIGVFRSIAPSPFILDANSNNYFDGFPPDKQAAFGQSGDIPVAGDWDGTGVVRIGVFRPSNGHWYLDMNNNGRWDGAGAGWDADIQFGGSTTTCTPTSHAGLAACLDQPIVGDWNGNGVSKLGIFRGVVGQFYLDNQNPTGSGCTGSHNSWTTASFGGNGDMPVAANWNGSTRCTVPANGPVVELCDQIGVFQQGTWYVNATGDGIYHSSDPVYYFGSANDFAVTGNWNGSGTPKKIGVFSGVGVWWVDIDNNHSFTQPPDQTFNYFGQPGDLPVVGGPWTLP